MTVSNLPVGNVDFDLDAYERPEHVEPFAVVVGGKRIVMTDPAELDWQDLIELEHPAEIIRLCVDKEGRDHLRELKLPFFKFEKLIEQYSAHYQLEDQIAEARRKQSHSSRF